jgi:hypothetical protein
MGRFPYEKPSFRSRSWDIQLDRAPLLGEHSELVLDMLGFSTDESAELCATGVIG